MNGFSIVSAISHADWIVKIILIVLLFCSVGTWSVFFQKISSIKINKFKNVRFEKKFWSGIMLEEFYSEVKQGRFASYYGDVFCAAMEEWTLSDITKSIMAVEFVKVGIRERLNASMENAKNKIQERMHKGLGFLSIMASVTPFVGLFGTVWGIMNSFAALGNATSVTLSAIAPGISEALFATAIGLFVAIPSVIFYNNLATKIDVMNATIDAFSVDVINVLSRELDTFSVKNYQEFNK